MGGEFIAECLDSDLHCLWEDETDGKGHPPSYADAKEMKSPTLRTHYCIRDCLRLAHARLRHLKNGSFVRYKLSKCVLSLIMGKDQRCHS